MYDLGCTFGESRNRNGPLQRLLVGGPCPLAFLEVTLLVLQQGFNMNET